MSEKPQAHSGGKQEDLLEQIFLRGLNKMDTSAQTIMKEDVSTEETHPAPQQEESSKADSAANGKNRGSAVYLYLLILFGAAFLLLLLAYFVQQRSSDNAISDLHNSINLSRQQLLDQIGALEEKNTALEESNTALRGELSTVYVDRAQWQMLYEQAALDASNFYDQVSAAQARLYGWGFIWTLEQYYQMMDYVTCARLLLLRATVEDPYPIPDAALWRYDEIVPAVINAGILREDYFTHPEDYSDLLEGDIAFNFDFIYDQTIEDVSRETGR